MPGHWYGGRSRGEALGPLCSRPLPCSLQFNCPVMMAGTIFPRCRARIAQSLLPVRYLISSSVTLPGKGRPRKVDWLPLRWSHSRWGMTTLFIQTRLTALLWVPRHSCVPLSLVAPVLPAFPVSSDRTNRHQEDGSPFPTPNSFLSFLLPASSVPRPQA